MSSDDFSGTECSVCSGVPLKVIVLKLTDWPFLSLFSASKTLLIVSSLSKAFRCAAFTVKLQKNSCSNISCLLFFSADTLNHFSCFVSTNNTEMDLFNEELSPGSQSPFPSFSETSSSSPRLCPNRADEGSAAFHLKVEKALQRADSKHLKRVDELRSQQPQESFPPKQHASESVRCQRSESFCLRRRVNPSAPVRHSSEKHRRPLSVGCVKQRSEVRCF